MVPVLIVSVVEAPGFVGVTVEDEKVTGPIPVRVGPPMPLARAGSTLSETGPPKAMLLFGALVSVRLKVTVSPTFAAVRAWAFDVSEKSRVTVPILIGTG